MHFLEIIGKTKNIYKIKSLYAQGKSISVQGLSELQKAYITAGVLYGYEGAAVVVLRNVAQKRIFTQILSELFATTPIYELSVQDNVFSAAAENKNYELLAQRYQALEGLAHNKKCIVFANADSFAYKYPPPLQQSNLLRLQMGAEFVLEDLLTSLVGYGYTRTDKVYDVGEFSLRGDILDIYPLNATEAVRVEFFGEKIDAMRYFDVFTQRSVENLQEVSIEPLINLQENNTCSISSYVQNRLLIINEQREMQEEMCELVEHLNAEINSHYLSLPELQEQCDTLQAINLTFQQEETNNAVVQADLLSTTAYNRKVDLFVNDAKQLLHLNKKVVLVMSSVAKAKAISKNLRELVPIKLILPEEDLQISDQAINCIVANLLDGAQWSADGLTIITEKDLFGITKQRKFVRSDDTAQINYFTDIKIGDYVVHNVHGIGQYIGIDKIEVDGLLKDYIIIRYAGTDKLYVLADQVVYLHKYIGNDGVAPKLSKMGGSDWTRLKNKAKLSVTDMAQDLLRLYAQREILEGFAFPKDDVWQKEFEDAFEYEETIDQLKAIREIKQDMQSNKPMDRLLCGDVGYGKTEVAMRAAYKAVLAGKQVAVLVPTTILARQHLQTFSERMASFGVRLSSLSRFSTPKEQKEVLEDLALGRLDVVIATHRILQNDIYFKNLGLLVIDEEQRFGVAQKEKIKKIAINVDTLTLSATPIPRTLHMTLLTAKDMSVIETAPENKMAVETYVLPENEEMIAQAVRRELRRGGSVYYVVRFIEHIDIVLRRLNRIVPEARVLTAHGRMAEGRLENNISAFYDGECDILLSTTIVENGLDVSQANTIIIQDADQFGLSQLYQMRGRVGRGVHLAYAYLMHKPQKSISEIAQKRLDAIRSFTQLGAGFKIAMRDLEIRGAGSILGDKQHGHVLSVGFQAYCQLLEETIEELRGVPSTRKVNFEPNIDIAGNMHISSTYMPDNSDKLEVYKRLAVLKSREDERDFVDELIDRFGVPPQDMLDMIKISTMRGMCREHGIKTLIAKGRELKIVFTEQPDIETKNLLKLLDIYQKNIKMVNGTNQQLILQLGKPSMDYLKLADNILQVLLPQC